MQQGLWSLAVGTKKDINNEAHLYVHDVSQAPHLQPENYISLESGSLAFIHLSPAEATEV